MKESALDFILILGGRSITTMKTTIEIDDALMIDALNATALTTQSEVVELALKTLIQIKRQEAIKSLRGQLPWDGDLESMRINS